MYEMMFTLATGACSIISITAVPVTGPYPQFETVHAQGGELSRVDV